MRPVVKPDGPRGPTLPGLGVEDAEPPDPVSLFAHLVELLEAGRFGEATRVRRALSRCGFDVVWRPQPRPGGPRC